MEYFKDLKSKLKEAGLDDKVIDGLVEFSKKSVPKEFVPSSELTKVKGEFDTLKDSVTDKDKVIKGLKTKADSVEAYEIKIEDLNTKMADIETDYTKKLKQKTLDNKLNEKISMMDDLNPKAKNAFKKLLDMEKINLDGENLIGFDEQAESIKKDNDYMTVKKQTKSDEPGKGDSTEVDRNMASVRAAMGLK